MKLFSTSNFEIPATLKIITNTVVPKIIFFLSIAKLPRKYVNFDLWSFFILIFELSIKFNKVGSSVNVIIKDVSNPIVIIQPKSMIGLISLKIKDKKAQIVVRTV